MDAVLNLIQSIGFPIACCLFLGYFIKQQNDEYREDVKSITVKYEAAIEEMSEKYERQIEKFSGAIDQNTQVLTAIGAKLERKESAEK